MPNAPEAGVVVDGLKVQFDTSERWPSIRRASSFNVPASLALPATMSFYVAARDDTMAWNGKAYVELVPVPVTATARSPQEAARPPAAVTLRWAKLKGKRLTLTATCIADQGYDGTVTLKSSQLRVARLNMGSVANGATKSVKATVAASRVRNLDRRKVATLRAVITPAMGQSVVSQLRLLRLAR